MTQKMEEEVESEINARARAEPSGFFFFQMAEC